MNNFNENHEPDRDGFAQFLLRYEHDKGINHCGATFFQCGRSALVVLTDLDRGVSITNTIESAASFVRSMHFLQVKPSEMIFFEHYRRDGGVNDFYRVKMIWDMMNERFCAPEFVQVTQDDVNHLLSCYGHNQFVAPTSWFQPAKVFKLLA